MVLHLPEKTIPVQDSSADKDFISRKAGQFLQLMNKISIFNVTKFSWTFQGKFII